MHQGCNACGVLRWVRGAGFSQPPKDQAGIESVTFRRHHTAHSENGLPCTWFRTSRANAMTFVARFLVACAWSARSGGCGPQPPSRADRVPGTGHKEPCYDWMSMLCVPLSLISDASGRLLDLSS
jgi:hypothetical protein